MTPAELVAIYFEAWQARDPDRLRSILADDVTFIGTLGTTDGVDETVAGLMGMAQIITDIEVLVRLADDTDVITWFRLHTTIAPPAATANWSHVEHGRITAIRATFDPREILAAGPKP
ncbi:MAG: nuclear transport factor 2 family protein [Acidimicrobiales bacterium]